MRLEVVAYTPTNPAEKLSPSLKEMGPLGILRPLKKKESSSGSSPFRKSTLFSDIEMLFTNIINIRGSGTSEAQKLRSVPVLG